MFLSFEWNHCITESLNSCVKERRVAFALGSATSAIVTRSLGRKQESSVFESHVFDVNKSGSRQLTGFFCSN